MLVKVFGILVEAGRVWAGFGIAGLCLGTAGGLGGYRLLGIEWFRDPSIFLGYGGVILIIVGSGIFLLAYPILKILRRLGKE